jgi:hypothetical protein
MRDSEKRALARSQATRKKIAEELRAEAQRLLDAANAIHKGR